MEIGSSSAVQSGVALTQELMDSEGILAFNNIAQEALKIERLVYQQKHEIKQMNKVLERVKNIQETEKARTNHLKIEVQYANRQNTLNREKSLSLRKSRHMIGQMASDLERQLYLEISSITNKVQAFETTQNKYKELWKSYEEVYLSSAEAKILQQETALQGEIQVQIKILEKEVVELTSQVVQMKHEKDLEWQALITKFAKMVQKQNSLLKEKQASENELLVLKEDLANKGKFKTAEKSVKKDNTCTIPDYKIEVDVTKKSTEKPKIFTTLRARYRELLSKNFMSSIPELDLPSFDEPPNIPDVPMETLSYRPIRYFSESPSRDFLNNRSPEHTQDLSPDLDIDMAGQQSQVAGEIEEAPGEAMVFSTKTLFEQPQEMETQMEEQEAEDEVSQEEMEPVQQDNELEFFQGEELNTQIISQSEVINEEIQLVGEQLFEEENNEQQMEQDWQGDFGSQISETAHNTTTSQSSKGSSLDLLDDENRREFMQKLLASPECPVMTRENNAYHAQMPAAISDEPKKPKNYMNSTHQTFHPEAVTSIPHNQQLQSYSKLPVRENQMSLEGATAQMELELTKAPAHHLQHQQVLPPAIPQPQLQAFSPMASLFGPPSDQQPQHNVNSQAFSFGNLFGVPEQGSTNNAALFGDNPFASQVTPTKGSETFTMNFDTKTNTSSIFQLF